MIQRQWQALSNIKFVSIIKSFNYFIDCEITYNDCVLIMLFFFIVSQSFLLKLCKLSFIMSIMIALIYIVHINCKVRVFFLFFIKVLKIQYYSSLLKFIHYDRFFDEIIRYMIVFSCHLLLHCEFY